MNNIKFDLNALQRSTDCLKQANYKTDLKIVKIEGIKYIELRAYCKIPLLGHLISFVRYWIYREGNISKQIRKIAETHKTHAEALVHHLFDPEVTDLESRFLDIQKYVCMVEGLLNQSGFPSPMSFESMFMDRFHQVFPKTVISQLEEAISSDVKSPEQITLISKSKRLLQINDLFKVSCTELNKLKTVISEAKSKSVPQENDLSQDKPTIDSFKWEKCPKETFPKDLEKKVEEVSYLPKSELKIEKEEKEKTIEVPSDSKLASQEKGLSPNKPDSSPSLEKRPQETPLEDLEKKTEDVSHLSKNKPEIEKEKTIEIPSGNSSASQENELLQEMPVNSPTLKNQLSKEALDGLVKKAEDRIDSLLNGEIEKNEMDQILAEVRDIKKQLKEANSSDAYSFKQAFQKWFDANFIKSDIDGIKTAYSTACFSPEISAKIGKFRTANSMIELLKKENYKPFEEIQAYRTAYLQLRKALCINTYLNNRNSVSSYVNFINKLLDYFSHGPSIDLNTSISLDFLQLVDHIEKNISQSTWEYLPAIKKQHNKIVEFVKLYRDLRNLENIPSDSSQQSAKHQIEIKVGVIRARPIDDKIIKNGWDLYNKSFGDWKLGDDSRLKCTFQFFEDKDAKPLYDLLIEPIWYSGRGRMEIKDINDDIADYLGIGTKCKLRYDGFAVILLIRGAVACLDHLNYSCFGEPKYYPEGLTYPVKDKTIFMSYVHSDENGNSWKNDTVFKEKIKNIIIKEVCAKKAKDLLQAK